MKRALILVDLQKDFCEGGSLPVSGGNGVCESLVRYVQKDGSLYKAFAFTRDWHVDPGSHFAPLGTEPDFVSSWPVHCVAGTDGARFSSAARGLVHTCAEFGPVDTFSKGQYEDAYSGFQGKNRYQVPLEIWLRAHGVDSVDIVGLALDYCVKATALDMADIGFQTRVLLRYTAGIGAVMPVVNELEKEGVVCA